MKKIQPFNPEKMETTIQMLEAFTTAIEDQSDQRPFALYMKEFSLYLNEILGAVSRGEDIVYNIGLWTELFYAFDIQPLCPIMWSNIPSLIDMEHAPNFMDFAENSGIFQELCSTETINLGKLLSGDIPRPLLMAVHTQPCDSVISSYSIFNQLYDDVPSFVVDSPNWDIPECLDYYTAQIKELISFMEEHTGKKLDRDRLIEVVEESNRAIEYIIDWHELKKLTPCPVNGLFAMLPFGGNLIGLGLPSITELYKELYEHARALADKGEGAYPREEIRSIWFQLHPLWDIGLQGWLQEEVGHVMAVDMLGFFTSVPIDTSSFDSIIRGLAERWHTSIPMGRQGRGSADCYINDLLYACKEFKGDVVICTHNKSCRYMKGMDGLAREACRDYGIPYFQIDIDVNDPRFISSESLRSQIADFLSNVVMPLKI